MLAAGARRRAKKFASYAEAKQRLASKPGFASFTSTSLDAHVQNDLLEMGGAPSGRLAVYCGNACAGKR
jgi:hypothetical protein